jgi:hypothetical protein
MHYGDKQQLKHQKLIITVYKDEWVDCDKTKLEDRKYCIHVESIVEARYVSTHSVCQLHYNIEHILREEIPKIESDVFYLVELKTDGWLWKVVKIKKLTNKMIDTNPLLGLH